MCTQVEGGGSKEEQSESKETGGPRTQTSNARKFTHVSKYKHLLCKTEDLSSVPNMHTQACKHKHAYTQHTCMVTHSAWYPQPQHSCCMCKASGTVGDLLQQNRKELSPKAHPDFCTCTTPTPPRALHKCTHTTTCTPRVHTHIPPYALTPTPAYHHT